MNFRLRGKTSIILMSVRPGAPYADRIEENGKILIYEGHDIPNRKDGPNPKKVDQEMFTPSGSLTENGKFFEAAQKYKRGIQPAERVKVYEKLRDGIWVYNGIFKLVDAWLEESNARKVFKFRLELVNELIPEKKQDDELEHGRIIPSEVKLAVWKRDKGKCVICGSSENLHFDHIIPYSKGGSSLVAENIQLLCARHNLAKHDKIE
ncbi:HNH endonuclease [Thermanaerosceptrum fracticalcis]|uniref:HNH endonuclease n=2 Tax=Thermanaerosceptrum fracticalcis TaxID=1712410 RepID=A0A7G6E8S4_THEFR|nr:HNH endonuclease [Thermanaerosceptrum fracticalcis]